MLNKFICKLCRGEFSEARDYGKHYCAQPSPQIEEDEIVPDVLGAIMAVDAITSALGALSGSDNSSGSDSSGSDWSGGGGDFSGGGASGEF